MQSSPTTNVIPAMPLEKWGAKLTRDILPARRPKLKGYTSLIFSRVFCDSDNGLKRPVGG
jgi:hypothetical protein